MSLPLLIMRAFTVLVNSLSNLTSSPVRLLAVVGSVAEVVVVAVKIALYKYQIEFVIIHSLAKPIL